ncbi:hypothetical protein DFH29DRAFT_377776 [Suillus ampliporus]|nr:hypothetical protein DFH29DRAFT_377776 [Suillus ampliporus]
MHSNIRWSMSLRVISCQLFCYVLPSTAGRSEVLIRTAPDKFVFSYWKNVMVPYRVRVVTNVFKFTPSFLSSTAVPLSIGPD